MDSGGEVSGPQFARKHGISNKTANYKLRQLHQRGFVNCRNEWVQDKRNKSYRIIIYTINVDGYNYLINMIESMSNVVRKFQRIRRNQNVIPHILKDDFYISKDGNKIS